MRALVTGAGGFAGSHLCELLLTRGAQVYALVIPGSQLDNLREFWPQAAGSERLSIREADIVDGESLVAAIADIRPDRVYHLAAVSSVRQSLEAPAETFQVNTVGTRNLLEAVRRVGTKPRILVVSSAEAYGESANLGRPLREEDPLLPVSPYGASKAAAEAVASRYVREFNLEVIRVRPFPHTGPRHAPQFVFPDWAQQLAAAEAGRRPPNLRVGNLDVQRDISDVRDVVRAYLVALERGEAGAVYNVCAGRVYSLRDVLQVLTGLSRLKVEVRAEPERLRPTIYRSFSAPHRHSRLALGGKRPPPSTRPSRTSWHIGDCVFTPQCSLPYPRKISEASSIYRSESKAIDGRRSFFLDTIFWFDVSFALRTLRRYQSENKQVS